MNHTYSIKKYNRITLADRINIKRLYYQGLSYAEIGREIGKHRSTIKYEIAKHGIGIGLSHNRATGRTYRYSANIAHATALENRHQKDSQSKFSELLCYFEEHYTEKDANIERMYLDFRMLFPKLSVPTLKTVYNGYHSKKLYRNIRLHRRLKKTKPASKPKPAGNPRKAHISLRDIKHDIKQEFGHFEIDTVYSSGSKTCVLTLNERSSGKYGARIIHNRQAETVLKTLLKLVTEIGLSNFKSITSDNGVEFSYSKMFTEITKITWYYCNTYSSWERGQNERLNRDLRKFFPKKTDFGKVTQSQIEGAVTKINNYSRTKHGYKSSNMVYEHKKSISKVENHSYQLPNMLKSIHLNKITAVR